MARYRKIDSRIWNDEKFRGLSDRGKLVFFMLLTHPHMTSIGAMRASAEGLAAEMGWLPKAFREAFEEGFSKGMVKYDPEASFVWLPRFLKYNAPESPNVLKAWGSALDLLPECALKASAIQNVKDFAEGLTEAFQKALPEVFAKAMPNPEPEPEPKKKKGVTRARENPDPPPDGLNLEAWERFAAYRSAVGKPIKSASTLAAQRKLAGFGADQAAVVEQSIANSWQGLFPLKDRANGTSKPDRKSRFEQNDEELREWAEQRGIRG